MTEISAYREMIDKINSQNKSLTELKELAEAASSAKSTFLANMSHEMRTPMNAIIGMANIAKQSDAISQKNECIGKIEDASIHLLGVINDILDMAKIEAGKFDLSPSEFDFKKMIESASGFISHSVNQKEQHFSITIDEEIPRILIGDRQRLSQAVINLLSNAVKFTAVRGSIALRASLSGKESGVCTVKIEVEDSGIGISEVDMEKLFKPFGQTDSDISRRYGGAGLGLVISGKIINMMGGEISVKSEPGKGSLFSFTVVLKIAAEQTIESDLPKTVMKEGCFAGRRVLFAEDIEVNREIIITLMEPTALTFDCAENGHDAFEMFLKAPESYDAILMDIQMPVMNGYDATKMIRELDIPKAKEIPIIAMTANAFQEDIDRCLASGINDHIAKPIDIDEVTDKLTRYFSKLPPAANGTSAEPLNLSVEESAAE